MGLLLLLEVLWEALYKHTSSNPLMWPKIENDKMIKFQIFKLIQICSNKENLQSFNEKQSLNIFSIPRNFVIVKMAIQ